MLTSAEIAAIAAKALDDKKARDIKVLKTDKQTVLADYFVICNGTSSTHIKALVDEVDKQQLETERPVRTSMEADMLFGEKEQWLREQLAKKEAI